MKQKKNPTIPVPVKLATRNVKVRATRLGYYDHKRRRVGDVFVMAIPVVDNDVELPSWCEPADKAGLKETGAQAALDAEAAATRLSNQSAAGAAPTAGDDLGI